MASVICQRETWLVHWVLIFSCLCLSVSYLFQDKTAYLAGLLKQPSKLFVRKTNHTLTSDFWGLIRWVNTSQHRHMMQLNTIQYLWCDGRQVVRFWRQRNRRRLLRQPLVRSWSPVWQIKSGYRCYHGNCDGDGGAGCNPPPSEM